MESNYEALDETLMLNLAAYADPTMVHSDGCVTITVDGLMALLAGIIAATAKGHIIPARGLSDVRH